MPKRRQRTTNRVPQDERRLRIRGARRAAPDVKKLSRAFIALALARAEAEAQAEAEEDADNRTPRTKNEEMPGDGRS